MSFDTLQAKHFLANLDAFIAHGFDTSKELQSRSYQAVKDNIALICQNAFPHSTIHVHLFGSRVIGVATEESDLDIFVDINGNFFLTYIASQENDERFNTLLSAISQSKVWQVKSHFSKTPVPVVKSVFLPQRLECKNTHHWIIIIWSRSTNLLITTGDIILTNGLSICHSKLLAHLFAIQPQAVSLFHFVKGWLSSQKFDFFQGYTLTLLVVFYLQRVKLMPPVEIVQKNLPKIIIAGEIKILHEVILKY